MSFAKKIARPSIKAKEGKQKEFFKLAQRLRNATDAEEAKRLGDELGRMVFGSIRRRPS